MKKRNRKKTKPGKAAVFTNTPFRMLQQKKNAIPAASPVMPVPEAPAPESAGSPDEEALRAMMDGAAPIDHRLVRPEPQIAEPRIVDDQEWVIQELDDLVNGRTVFDIADTDEYIEASVQGLDQRIVKKLRRGDYSFQSHLDLHGFTRVEARARVAAFIDDARRRGLRCVLIVHGRGLGSKDHMPVLKEKLRAWLTRGALGRKVLAFTSARPYDGGTGAVYVLLRG